MKRMLAASVLGLAVSSSAFAITPFQLPWMNSGTDGTSYNTADHADGIFVLEFLANFCPACNHNADSVNALADDYKDKDRVQVLDMSIDKSDKEIASWIAKHNPNHPVLKDGDRVVFKQVDSKYIPTTVIMDCKGNVAFKQVGTWDDDEKAAIKKAIDGLLDQDCK